MKTHGKKKKRGNTLFQEVSIETISIIKRVKLLSLTQTLNVMTAELKKWRRIFYGLSHNLK